MKGIRKKEQALPQEPTVSVQPLMEIAVEAWRLDRVVDKALQRMSPMDAERLVGQYRWFRRKVDAAMEDAGLRAVDLTGQAYSIGMAVTALNMDEFDDDEDLTVAQMVEPVILFDGRVMRTGAVILEREE